VVAAVAVVDLAAADILAAADESYGAAAVNVISAAADESGADEAVIMLYQLLMTSPFTGQFFKMTTFFFGVYML
jgi:hypothetical protein